jgi:hypothetical protein
MKSLIDIIRLFGDGVVYPTETAAEELSSLGCPVEINDDLVLG